MITILTLHEDLHALEVRRSACRLGYRNIHIVECDRISGCSPIGILLGQRTVKGASSYCTSSDGIALHLAESAAIWLRRPTAAQVETLSLNAKEREFVNNECSAGVTSLLSTGGFRGKWVSHPEATAKACDKVFQLQVAFECGFRIPATLVSQSKAEVIEFYETCGRKIIVKPLLGVAEPFLVARMVDDPSLLSDEAYSACPAIYQEFIPGTRHVRLNCFGPIQVAALIESEDLDWRPNLNVPIYRWTIPPDVETRVQRVLQSLGLEMGIIDLKLTPDGEIVWLEVNAQGQFLFLEPFIKADLSGCLARFLIDCAA